MSNKENGTAAAAAPPAGRRFSAVFNDEFKRADVFRASSRAVLALADPTDTNEDPWTATGRDQLHDNSDISVIKPVPPAVSAAVSPKGSLSRNGAAKSSTGGVHHSKSMQFTEGVAETTVVTHVLGQEAEIAVKRSQRLKGRTAHIAWEITYDGQTHVVDLFHGRLFGKRQIDLDSKTLVSKYKFLDAGGEYAFDVFFHNKEVTVTVQIYPTGLSFEYHLFVNQERVEF